ncbi:hypothetical protein TRIUR3_18616 [Triticum urartu]|uniref:Uncharacterized protein n=1 Tax=Triticum urartu TaxID=4572 RepID=M7ZGI7_TRIUA|nr:hypothetical protein TRIUR3_18616 [Triticum urartu]
MEVLDDRRPGVAAPAAARKPGGSRSFRCNSELQMVRSLLGLGFLIGITAVVLDFGLNGDRLKNIVVHKVIGTFCFPFSSFLERHNMYEEEAMRTTRVEMGMGGELWDDLALVDCLDHAVPPTRHAVSWNQ